MQSKQTKQVESSKSQNFTNQQDNSQSNLSEITRELYEDSDLTIISHELKKEHFVTLGDYRLTEIFKTKDEAIKWCEEPSWKKIMLIVSAMIDWSINNQNQFKNRKEVKK